MTPGVAASKRALQRELRPLPGERDAQHGVAPSARRAAEEPAHAPRQEFRGQQSERVPSAKDSSARRSATASPPGDCMAV